MPSTKPARGMRDFLPADVRRREYVIGKIREVYERYGFEPLETPAVENIETLTGKYGEEGNQLIYKILKRGVHESTGEADLALRYDLTVPLARVVAEYRDKLPKFFKRYQIQPVWRADRPARGRFREFYQCDVDALGSKSMIVEAELCAAVSDALAALGFNDFAIRLNHREILTSLLSVCGIPLNRQSDALVALDKLEKIGRAGVAEELSQRAIPDEAAINMLNFFDEMNEAARRVEQLVSPTGIPASAKQQLVAKVNEKISEGQLKQLRTYLGSDKTAQRGLDELDSIIKLTKRNGAGSRIRIDFGLARGLSYYTGPIMEVSVTGIGSLGGGGRYDNLVGMFLGEDVPACGFSLGLERIIVVMTERGMFPPDLAISSADVLIASLAQDFLPEAVSLATDLRKTGIQVSLYPDATKKPQKALSYADAQKIPLVILIGESEYKEGAITVRNLVERNQETVFRQVAVDVVQAMLLAAKRTLQLDRLQEEASLKSAKEWLREH